MSVIVILRACASLGARSRAPSFVVVQAPGGLITLFIQLPDSTTLEVMDTAGPYIGHVKDAIIAEFKLDAAPQQLRLFRLGDASSGSRTSLDPPQSLSEAGIVAGTKLAVELSAATSAGLASML